MGLTMIQEKKAEIGLSRAHQEKPPEDMENMQKSKNQEERFGQIYNL